MLTLTLKKNRGAIRVETIKMPSDSTSIKIRDETKRDLFKVAARLQDERGEKVSLDEAIVHLIARCGMLEPKKIDNGPHWGKRQ